MRYSETMQKTIFLLGLLGIRNAQQLKEYIKRNDIRHEKQLLVQAQYEIMNAMFTREG